MKTLRNPRHSKNRARLNSITEQNVQQILLTSPESQRKVIQIMYQNRTGSMKRAIYNIIRSSHFRRTTNLHVCLT